MPTEGTHDITASYGGLLAEVRCLIQKYQNDHVMLWTGDINSTFRNQSHPTQNDRLLEACQELNMATAMQIPDVSTFFHFNSTSES